MSSKLINITLNVHSAGSVAIRSRLSLLSATWSFSSHSTHATVHALCSYELIWPRAILLEESECILSARIRITLIG